MARRRVTLVAVLLSTALGMLSAGQLLVSAVTALDPSDVVLVFDVSDSILQSPDGTNIEFATALEGIADRVATVADDLAVGNAQISFEVFGRQAIPYPANCQKLDLHGDPAAVVRFETCLRSIAAEYRAGKNAPVRKKVDTTATDHVAALVEAERLLPNRSSRAAVIFFTDGKHDPPGTSRDNEDVVARVTPAFQGRTPLAILPVGLGAGAGAFESELQSIYTAFFRDMQPCEGRATFSWPEVIFPSADVAGAAVALALQEVTCSFTVAPTPTPAPTPTAIPTPTPTESPSPTPSPPPVVNSIPGTPGQPRVEPLDSAARLTVDTPTAGGPVEQYVYACSNDAGGSTQGAGSGLSVVVNGLVNGATYQCVAYAENRLGRSGPSEASASFKPCSGLLDCNPLISFGMLALVLAAIVGAIAFAAWRFKNRNRVWIAAQVDGGENRQLGWGPEIGIRLELTDAVWLPMPGPYEGADIRVRYRGEGQFVVQSRAGTRDVHQGDPATVRDESGFTHLLTLRRYRGRPRQGTPPPPARVIPGAASVPAVGERLHDSEPREPEPAEPAAPESAVAGDETGP